MRPKTNTKPVPGKAEARRGTRTQRGYDNNWLRYSARFRQLNPLCADPHKIGCINPSECVDHVKRHKGQSDPLFWDASNHRALCTSCHNRKTAEEDRRKDRERETPATKLKRQAVR